MPYFIRKQSPDIAGAGGRGGRGFAALAYPHQALWTAAPFSAIGKLAAAIFGKYKCGRADSLNQSAVDETLS
jgi:hypothetical protein